MDDAIADALRRIAGLLRVERRNLIGFSPGDETCVTYSRSCMEVP